MWFFAGNIATQAMLEYGGRNLDFTDLNVTNSFKSALAINYNTTVDNISLFAVTDTDVNVQRINRGDSFVLAWINGQVSGIDFTIENNKRIITLYATDSNGNNSLSFIADGIDFLNVTISSMLPDMSAVDATCNQTILLPIINPNNKMAYVKLNIVNGIAVKQFKTTEYGMWRVPAGADLSGCNARVKYDSVYQINALMAV